MAKTQLKLLLFLIVLGITLGCMATAYYIYDKVLKPEKAIQDQMAGMKKVNATHRPWGEALRSRCRADQARPHHGGAGGFV